MAGAAGTEARQSAGRPRLDRSRRGRRTAAAAGRGALVVLDRPCALPRGLPLAGGSALCRGDRMGIAYSLGILGVVAWFQADYARAAALLEECLTLARELGYRWPIAMSLSLLGQIAQYLRGP